MNTYNVKAVLFDLDGVLIDSNIEIEKFWQGWAAKERILFTKETVEKNILGRTTLETINELFINSSEQIKEEIYKSAVDFDMNMQPDLIKDADRFLKELATFSQKIALVTSSPKIRAKRLLERHNIYSFFINSVTGEDVISGKPNPEPYLLGASKLNLNPEECLVFEDSNNGIISALAAGMYVIAVGNKMENQNIITRINNYVNLKVENNIIVTIDKSIRIKLIN
jgi:HAD superfamily hydrolase (TIGR01509 family)